MCVTVAYPHHFDADPDPSPACHFDADPDPTFYFDADPDPDPGFQVKTQNLEKVLKYAHIPYIFACHLQIDADPEPDPAYHYKADSDPDPTSKFDPDPQHWCVYQLIES